MAPLTGHPHPVLALSLAPSISHAADSIIAQHSGQLALVAQATLASRPGARSLASRTLASRPDLQFDNDRAPSWLHAVPGNVVPSMALADGGPAAVWALHASAIGQIRPALGVRPPVVHGARRQNTHLPSKPQTLDALMYDKDYVRLRRRPLVAHWHCL